MFVAEGDQAKLLYAPAFFAAVHERFGDAGIIAILAHELGHALDDTLGAAWIQNAWTPELRADAWAGCVLAKDPLAAPDRQAAMSALAEYPSSSHPNWNIRLPVIRAGYTHCGGTAKLDAPPAKAKRP
jgi:hypothetical protein